MSGHEVGENVECQGFIPCTEHASCNGCSRCNRHKSLHDSGSPAES